MIRKKTILILSLFTLVGFSLLGYWIAYYFLDMAFVDMLKGDATLFFQILAGIVYGIATALVGWQIVKSHLLKPVRKFFVSLIQSLNLSPLEIVFISICAGVGEEILFRGAIQPLLGIWLTAIFFVAIHGYLNPMKWRLMIYGIYMTLIIAGIGYLKIHMGLITAITAHIFIDIVLLTALNNSQAKDRIQKIEDSKGEEE